MKKLRAFEFISYVFVKKTNFVSFFILQFYITIHLKDFVFISGIPGGDIYFIRNKSSSFVIYIVETLWCNA